MPTGGQSKISSGDISERKRAEERLAYYAHLLENLHDAVVATDERFVVTAWNRSAEEMYGWSADEVLGRNMSDVVHSDLSDEQEAEARRQLSETGRRHAEVTIFRRDGTPIYVEARSVALRGEQGQITGYLGITRDITERKRAEDHLRRSEAHLAEAQRVSHTGSWVWNVGTGELSWSLEHFRMFGVDPGTFKPTKETTQKFIHPEDLPSVEQTLQRAVRERSDFDVEYRIIRPDGSIRYHRGLGHPVVHESSDLEFIGTVVDVTENKEQEQVRRELSRRLSSAQEDERRRISRELHDQFGQQLSVLALKLADLRSKYAGDPNLAEQLGSLETIAKQLDVDVDFIAWQLRPTALDDLGLAAALTDYVKGWSEHFNIHAESRVAGIDPKDLTNEIETAFYRIAQEALNNIAKHAGARNVDILLESRLDDVSLIIEDDGTGFDTERAFSAEAKGMGLIGMRERAVLVGGKFDIESSPGKGTTVVARIPVEGHSPRKGI